MRFERPPPANPSTMSSAMWNVDNRIESSDVTTRRTFGFIERSPDEWFGPALPSVRGDLVPVSTSIRLRGNGDCRTNEDPVRTFLGDDESALVQAESATKRSR